MPGKWLPGESGNPGGRPRTKRYASAARELLAALGGKAPVEWGPRKNWSNAQEGAYRDLRAWLDEHDQLAATRLLDRAEGKPAAAEEDRLALATTGRGIDELRAALTCMTPSPLESIEDPLTIDVEHPALPAAKEKDADLTPGPREAAPALQEDLNQEQAVAENVRTAPTQKPRPPMEPGPLLGDIR